QVESEARRYFENKVYKSVIPRNVRISEAPSHGLPVIEYDKNCAGTIAYESLAKEVLEQYKQNPVAA
ncbi:MAG: ParA family protein, partial [alpha proteobacterium HIMB114]